MNVYVITNESFDGWVKVGKSSCVEQRLQSYQTSAPTRYVLEFSAECFDDAPVHSLLKDQDIESSGEWFKCSVDTARDAILEVAAQPVPEYVERQRVIDEEQGEIVFFNFDKERAA